MLNRTFYTILILTYTLTIIIISSTFIPGILLIIRGVSQNNERLLDQGDELIIKGSTGGSIFLVILSVLDLLLITLQNLQITNQKFIYFQDFFKKIQLKMNNTTYTICAFLSWFLTIFIMFISIDQGRTFVQNGTLTNNQDIKNLGYHLIREGLVNGIYLLFVCIYITFLQKCVTQD